MEFANQRAFDLDPNGLQARGQYVGTAIKERYGDHHIVSEGGIVNPQRDELMPGAIIVRFGGAGSAALPHLTLKGGWWLAWVDYQQVELIAKQDKISFERAWRAGCQVPPGWNDMQLVIQARVTRPLLAWRGYGKPVAGASQRSPKVPQLFIPGLQYTGREQMIALTGSGWHARDVIGDWR